MTKTTSVLLAIAALVIGLVGGFFLAPKATSLGATAYDNLYQVGNIYQGQSGQLIASNGIVVGTLGGSAFTTLNLSASTTLASNYDCLYDTISLTTSTAAVTMTLPTATNMDTCLTQNGTQEVTEIQIATGNNFNMTIATSTGDTLVYNATSTAGGATLATSSAGAYYRLEAFRFSSSSIVFLLGNSGIGH